MEPHVARTRLIRPTIPPARRRRSGSRLRRLCSPISCSFARATCLRCRAPFCSGSGRPRPHVGSLLGPYPTHRVAAYTAFDLYASYALQSSFGTTSLAGGVRNLFDAAPPAVYDSFLTYADPTYDFVGRYVYGRLAHKF